MRMLTALVLLGGGLAAAARAHGSPNDGGSAPGTVTGTGARAGDPPATAATFESFEILAQDATPAIDIATLLGPVMDRCPEGGRDLDRARCRATQAYLRRTLPERAFSIVVQDPAAISVSPYDPALKGYRLGLAPCVACTTPIAVGRSAQPVLITLTPAGEVSMTTLGFASEAEAVRWLHDVRPRLRATFVFKLPAPAAAEARPPAREARSTVARSYALELIAGRVVDPCTGTVILSSPPSTGNAERGAGAGCPATTRPASATTAASTATDSRPVSDDEEPQLPIELSRNAISEAMGQIRSQVFACFQQYKIPGTAQLTYEVAGNGLVQAVRIEGALQGTPTGACVVQAARNAHFPRFDGPIQTFSYPFFLRR